MTLKLIITITFGVFFVLLAITAKITKLQLHKVAPNSATLVEIWGGSIKKIFTAGLYLLFDFSPFFTIKLNNCSLAIVSIEPIAGLEEDWGEDWQEDKARHPNFEEIDWNHIPKIEFDDGSSGLIEFILMLKVKDLEKYAYAGSNPVVAIVAYAKGLLRKEYTQLTFNTARKDLTSSQQGDSSTIQKNMLSKIAIFAKDYGIEVIIPEDNLLVKMFYPSPATEDARDKLFNAKATGKSTAELADGEAKAAEKRGAGWGKGIAAGAKEAGLGVSVKDVYARDLIKTTVEGLGDKTVVLNTGGSSVASAAAGFAGITNAINKGSSSREEETTEGDNA